MNMRSRKTYFRQLIGFVNVNANRRNARRSRPAELNPRPGKGPPPLNLAGGPGTNRYVAG